MRIIDADAHVEECTETWNFLDKEFHKQRPLPVKIEEDTPYGPNNAFWFIDGKAYPKLAGRGLHTFGTPPISEYAKSKPNGDPSHEEDMVGEVEKRTDLKPRLHEKILSDNPQRLYGL